MARPEQVLFRLPGQVEEALLGHRVRLDPAVAENVGNVDAALDESPPNQQAAMAGKRIVFQAHQSEPHARGDCFDLRQPLKEQRLLGHRLIVRRRFVSTSAPSSRPR